MNSVFKHVMIVLFLGVITGCAAHVPKEISEAPPVNVSLNQVKPNILQYTNTRVRWGGTIALVENHAKETWIEIVARDLDRNGTPIENDTSAGRFIAIVDGFLDPVLYAKGRNITVAGVIENELTRKIGDYDYTFTIVRVSMFLLWEKYDPYPYWYYDWWYPYPYPPPLHRHHK